MNLWVDQCKFVCLLFCVIYGISDAGVPHAHLMGDMFDQALGVGAAEGAGREPVLPNLARADGPQLPAADRAEQQPGRTHADAPVAALDVHAADVLGDVARQVQAQQQF